MIGLLLKTEKFVNFIVDLGIVQLPLFLELVGRLWLIFENLLKNIDGAVPVCVL